MLEQILFIIKKDRTALMVQAMRMMVILRKRQLSIQLSQSQLTMVILTGFAVGAEVVQGILTGFIKLQIRLLSIDKQNSYAIIAVRENDNKRE